MTEAKRPAELSQHRAYVMANTLGQYKIAEDKDGQMYMRVPLGQGQVLNEVDAMLRLIPAMESKIFDDASTLAVQSDRIERLERLLREAQADRDELHRQNELRKELRKSGNEMVSNLLIERKEMQQRLDQFAARDAQGTA